jgi:hypothetical protein
MTTITVGTLPEARHIIEMRKAVVAATIGTTIEWYDFFIYGTAAGLVFGKLYFPNEDPLTATLAAFGTYFVGFVGRPIGAAIFGHYGDRIGRKATLIGRRAGDRRGSLVGVDLPATEPDPRGLAPCRRACRRLRLREEKGRLKKTVCSRTCRLLARLRSSGAAGERLLYP